MTQEPVPWAGGEKLDQRVSHEDRERVAEVLRVAAGDGRLSLEELEERLESCFGARTYGALAPLVADLPGQTPVTPAEAVRTKDVVRVRRVGASLRYEGPWVAPRRLEAEVRGGNVVLDFSTATVRGAVTHVDVELRGGNLRLIVPDGYSVDADEIDIRGGSVRHRHAQDRPQGIPITHQIVITGKLTGGNVVIQPPRPPRRPGLLRRMLGGGK
ncbi:DUF1707 SHOCT-like domain-containing protein [Streptomyces sp. NBC_00448]|uniref:DUF1707 SHOCT-like domain-containing protein n=1 Tax=Streptomyces sp. NBC_00448 TaxID=2903652 RepID=UPI002E21390F